MGMYTQVRGWFCLDSIGDEENFRDAEARLQQAKDNLLADPDQVRGWIGDDVSVRQGGNDTLWLFVGMEFKNYNQDVDLLVKHLRQVFPGMEGRLDLQYEEVEAGDQTCTWLINRDGIQKESVTAWTYGYGLDYKQHVIKPEPATV